MPWFIAYFLAEIWNHRRNRFIAVGGTSVVVIFVMLFLARLPETPEWLLRTFGVICGVLIVVTIAMMCYYIVKFVVTGCVRLWRLIGHEQNARHVAERKE